MVIDRYTYAAVAGAIMTATLCYLALGFRGPIIPDEVGYLSIANYMATGTAFNMVTVANYSFGQAMLLLPGFALFDDPVSAYRAGLAATCLMTGLVPVVLIGIAHRLGYPPSWQVLACSVLVAVFPAYFYHNFVVWSEALFRLAFLMTVYVFATAWVSRRTVAWCAVAALSIVLYAIHPRAIGIVAITMGGVGVALVFEKASRWQALAALAVAALLWLGVREVNNHLEVAIWGREISDGSKIAGFLGQLAADPVAALAVAAGHAWALLASSLGFYALGMLMWAEEFRRSREARPLLIFALACALLVFAASVAQMLVPVRVDHAIYARYNDGVSTLFVWLGLLWVMKPRSASMSVLAVALPVAFTAVWVVAEFGGAGLAGSVPPNLSGLLWAYALGVPIHSATLVQIVGVGSLMAIAVGCAAAGLSSRPVVATVAVACVVVFADFQVFKSVTGGHLGRDGYVTSSRGVFERVGPAPVHWDNSAAANGNLLIDQFSALERPMPASDLVSTEIAEGSAAVVGPDFTKDGYSCVGRFRDQTKLVYRGDAKPEWSC